MPDSTLSSLLPSFPMCVAGRRIHLRPVTVEELPAVERVWDGWLRLIASKGDDLEVGAVAELLELLGAASGQGTAWIKSLGEEDFESVLSHALALNEEILNPPPMPNAEPFTWAQIAQKLIQAGHPWESVKTYTLAQVRAFIEAVAEQEREAFADAIQAASFAMVSPQETQKIASNIRHKKR